MPKKGNIPWNKGKKYTTGFKHSKETKKKLSLHKLGAKNPMYDKTFSQEHRNKLSQSHCGEKAYQWKGDDACYVSIHRWLNIHYTKTGSCNFCHQKRKTHWAKKNDKKYSRNINDYYELCVSCHKKYDLHCS